MRGFILYLFIIIILLMVCLYIEIKQNEEQIQDNINHGVMNEKGEWMPIFKLVK
jgi:hypothetical protein